jgi:hypothetical protein
VLEIGGGHRPLGRDPLQDRVGFGAPGAGEAPEALPAGLAALGPRHPPAQQGMERERQQRSLVRPIFEQAALAPFAPGGAVDEGAVIRAKAREGRQVMGAGEDVDAVDLVEREPIEGAAERAPIGHRTARRAEALRGERDPARGGEGEGVSVHRASLRGAKRRSNPVGLGVSAGLLPPAFAGVRNDEEGS